ncbi:DNA-binding transcriptional regulator, FadR family [Kaistia soli DSM 19436]|uniref:DNA-binding transcriptional regulator, FadR family n=1 Tax=Kaistia soli DSM 19436 TaxID=1122133 RepID=A0A1M5KN49_9HYPH|nr:FCD domain-containing protein [Kaistia soli]SHG54207.1 DNA-binding transcriptional regulator, FadR family [Kaistia soli DSM 19436]
MSAPIFADPVLDGAADPTVIRRRGTNEWWMFYTNRRATFEGPGVAWVHGSPIGIAVSSDGGRSWHYRGTVQGLDDPADPGLNTHWAPEVIFAEGEYHMYLSYISGTPDRWPGHKRQIVHFVSDDLMSWRRIGPIALSSDYVIDAAVARCPDGLYRLWYKDEGNGSGTGVAASPDLYEWTVEGVAIPPAPGHEGPNVFALGGWYWMIVDEWRGLAAFRSSDARAWDRQGLILDRPGSDPLDRQIGRHADVVPLGDRAAIYYFTHPHWSAAHTAEAVTFSDRRTVIHAATLTVENDRLVCRRDQSPEPLGGGDAGEDDAMAATAVAPSSTTRDGSSGGMKAALGRPRVHAGMLETLVGRILGGIYREGEPLPAESVLCTELEVSHSALREALRVLSGKGIVKARPRLGTIVQPRRNWSVVDAQLIDWMVAADHADALLADLIAARLWLEPAAAAMAAGAATGADLAALEAALAEMSAAARLDDIKAYVAADAGFHRALMKASGNRIFEQLAAVITPTDGYCLRVNALRGIRPREAVKLHERLVDSIRLRDPEAATAIAASLLADVSASRVRRAVGATVGA